MCITERRNIHDSFMKNIDFGFPSILKELESISKPAEEIHLSLKQCLKLFVNKIK